MNLLDWIPQKFVVHPAGHVLYGPPFFYGGARQIVFLDSMGKGRERDLWNTYSFRVSVKVHHDSKSSCFSRSEGDMAGCQRRFMEEKIGCRYDKK